MIKSYFRITVNKTLKPPLKALLFTVHFWYWHHRTNVPCCFYKPFYIHSLFINILVCQLKKNNAIRFHLILYLDIVVLLLVQLNNISCVWPSHQYISCQRNKNLIPIIYMNDKFDIICQLHHLHLDFFYSTKTWTKFITGVLVLFFLCVSW